MYLNQKQIDTMRHWLSKISKDIRQKSYFCFLFSDETRLKILLILKQQKRVCVTDIARILDLTISAVSHQLAKMEKMGLVKRCKKGQIVCYSLLSDRQIIKCLTDFKRSTK